MKLTDEEILKIAERAWQDTRLLCPIDDESIYTLTFARALLEALDAIGRAKKATDALVHAACISFASWMADITGERITVLIGETPIAREK